MIQDGYKFNFQTLLQAAEDGNLCIRECRDKATGETIIAVCAAATVPVEGSFEVQLTPVAKLFNGNPYEELEPVE